MKTATQQTAKFTGIIAMLFLAFTINGADLELRFQTVRLDKQTHELFVEVQVQNSNEGQLILAGQNYRVFYDSEILSLDTEATKSQLPVSKYSALSFEKHLQGVKADDINQLNFDDNLGFANFFIDLTDIAEGGISINKEDEWVAVATLKFNIKKLDESFEIVWGRESVSDKYATAYVEMAQWKSQTELERLNISYYGDLVYQPTAEKSIEDITMTIGPNPAVDFVQISFNRPAESDVAINLVNTAGQRIKNAQIKRGESFIQIDVAELPGATYIVEISNPETGLQDFQPIVVAK